MHLEVHQWRHGTQYIYGVLSDEVAAAIDGFCPRTVPKSAGDFARAVVASATPHSVARARALLFAAGKLGAFATSIGLELSAEVVLHPSVIERFTVTERSALSGATRRTLRSNLRALAKAVLVHQPPGPVPLSRERTKAPYTDAELAAYFALAHHQPTLSRQRQAEGLLALGAGAGLMGADLRHVRGTDVVARSGGLLVEVAGQRPRVVPVLARYHEVLSASAGFAGARYVVGGTDPNRHNVTTPLIARLSGGADLERPETSRLRATWLVAVAHAIGLKAFLDAAGISCSQRLGDLVATLPVSGEDKVISLLGGRP